LGRWQKRFGRFAILLRGSVAPLHGDNGVGVRGDAGQESRDEKSGGASLQSVPAGKER